MATHYSKMHLQDHNISEVSELFPTMENFSESKEENSIKTKRDIPSRLANVLPPDENYETENKKKSIFEFKGFTQQPTIWSEVFVFASLHFISIASLVYIPQMKFLTIIWTIFLQVFSGFGITAGAHRLWSHRSYKAKLQLKIILLVCYSTAGIYSLYRFVRDHRTHHKFTDTDADPHNSKRGFWFSHIGWLVQEKHPDLIKKQATIDMSDITDDPLLDFYCRHFVYFRTLFCFILPVIPPIWLWNEYWWYAVLSQLFVRNMIALNVISSVNSVAHLWGQRPYDKNISAVQNKHLSFFTFGEGWHNYHHVFPWDYRASEFGMNGFNLTTNLIDQFQKIGWAYDVKTVSPQLFEDTIKKKNKVESQ